MVSVKYDAEQQLGHEGEGHVSVTGCCVFFLCGDGEWAHSLLGSVIAYVVLLSAHTNSD